MGRGNHWPAGANEYEFCMVYVEFPQYTSDNQWAHWHSKLTAALLKGLPGSFYKADHWGEHDEFILAHNNLIELRKADNEWSEAIILRVRQTDEDGRWRGLAVRALEELSKKFFPYLKRQGYKLYVRDGAWQSTEWKPGNETRG